MVRGFEFYEPDQTKINRVLRSVLSLEALSYTKLRIVEDEIIADNDNYRIPSERPCDVADCIEKTDPYIIFLNLQALPRQAEAIEIRSYEDFLKSSCLLVFLIVDVYDVEIYAKDETLRREIAKIIQSYGCDSSWKTDENDGRTGFSLF